MSNPALTSRDILDLPMQENDAEASTIREYLVALLTAVWSQQEAFSGKRPFGNSDWADELYITLIQAGVIPGQVDESNYLDEITYENRRAADAVILDAIKAINA